MIEIFKIIMLKLKNVFKVFETKQFTKDDMKNCFTAGYCSGVNNSHPFERN